MNAIILCAGIGSRFQPVSLTCPKHLVPISGLPLLEHTIKMLRQGGICDISIVTGHLAEQFEYLEDKYQVSLVFNPGYTAPGNSGSLALVAGKLDAGKLDGTLIIDGDVLFTRDIMPQVMACREKLGAGTAFFVSQRTEHGLEWELEFTPGQNEPLDNFAQADAAHNSVTYFPGQAGAAPGAMESLPGQTDTPNNSGYAGAGRSAAGTIRQIAAVRKWSPSGFAMCGLSYWAGEAAALLVADLRAGRIDSSAALPADSSAETTADSSGESVAESSAGLLEADYSWEDAAVRVLRKCALYALCLEERFALELDVLKDALDFHLLSHEEIARLCSVNYTPVKLKGLTNNTWKVRAENGAFNVLRVPGRGTEHYIKRAEEALLVPLLDGLGITPATRFFPDGFKFSQFLPRHRVSTAGDMTLAYFAALAACLKKMHAIPHTAEYGLEPVRIRQYMQLFEEKSGYRLASLYQEWLIKRAASFDAEGFALCHRDLLLENIMILDENGTGLQLIDFEYAGFAHPLWDYASFILESGIEGAVRDQFLLACGITDEREKSRLHDMEILQDYIWGMWGLVNNYQDYAEIRLKRALNRLRALCASGA